MIVEALFVPNEIVVAQPEGLVTFAQLTAGDRGKKPVPGILAQVAIAESVDHNTI